MNIPHLFLVNLHTESLITRAPYKTHSLLVEFPDGAPAKLNANFDSLTKQDKIAFLRDAAWQTSLDYLHPFSKADDKITYVLDAVNIATVATERITMQKPDCLAKEGTKLWSID